MADIAAFQSSIIDGIALTPRYRERELASLYQALENARSSVLEAISGGAITPTEGLAQYVLTLHAIKNFHSTVNPQTCLEEEYQIARSKDHPSRRAAYGYAHIVPALVDVVYSTIVPVAAAIAAGNCVLVERAKQKTKISILLQTLLTRCLSAESFAFVDQDPFGHDFQQSYRILVRGDMDTGANDTFKCLSTAAANVGAVVDRSGDVKAAAQDFVVARFAFQGTSTYAPDFILVHEYCLKEFVAAAAESGLQYLTGQVDQNTEPTSGNALQDSLPEYLKTRSTVVAAGGKGQILLLRDRADELLSHKMNSATLVIVPISSQDDAIDLLGGRKAPLLANYIYASPEAAKYLSQFIRSAISLVNHIPVELLIGPAAPDGFVPCCHPRYTTEMFSVPAPTLVKATTLSGDLRNLIWPDRSASGGRKTDLLDTTLARVKEPFGPTVGYFEQGFLIGASIILSTVILCCSLSVKYGYPALVTRLSRI